MEEPKQQDKQDALDDYLRRYQFSEECSEAESEQGECEQGIFEDYYGEEGGIMRKVAQWYSDEESVYSSTIESSDAPEKPPIGFIDEEGRHACLATLTISNSALLHHPLRNFPNIPDPGIDILFEKAEQPPYDISGVTQYFKKCAELKVTPIGAMKEALKQDTINLRYYGLSPLALRALCPSLTLNPYVIRLDLTDTILTRDMSSQLAAMLAENVVIKILNLTNCRMGPSGMQVMAESLGQSISLTTLLLPGNNLEDEGMEYLAQSLIDNSNMSIEYLDLGYNHLGIASGRSLMRLLMNNDSLTHLQLAWNDLYPTAAIEPLFKGLCNNKNIIFVGLAWNGLRGEPFGISLRKFLRKSKVIEEIDVSYNQIDEKTMDCFLRALRNSKTVRKFHVGGNPLNSDLTSVFAIVTCANKHNLEFVGMRHLWITKEALEQLDQQAQRWMKEGERTPVIYEYEGVMGNLPPTPPNLKEIAMDRARFLIERKKPPKKKKKKPKKPMMMLGHFMLALQQENVEQVPKQDFLDRIKKARYKKLDPNLLNFWMEQYQGTKKDLVNLKKIADDYLIRNPTEPLPPPDESEAKPKKKKKKGGKKGDKKGEKKDAKKADDKDKKPGDEAKKPEDEAKKPADKAKKPADEAKKTEDKAKKGEEKAKKPGDKAEKPGDKKQKGGKKGDKKQKGEKKPKKDDKAKKGAKKKDDKAKKKVKK